MSEIICFYTFPESNESNYFLVENNISLHQLKEFVINMKLIDDSFTIETACHEPLTEENLVPLIAEAASSDSPLQILFKRKATSPVAAPEPAIPQPVLEPKIERIGPIMRSILEKIGVKFDESVLSDVENYLASLPFPYSSLFKQYLQQAKENASALPTTVKIVADMFSVDNNALLHEVTTALEFIKNPPAPEPMAKQPEAEISSPSAEESLPEASSLVGPILTQIFTQHFGIAESCLNSKEQITNLVKNLPLFRPVFIFGGRPKIISSLADALSKGFSVNEEILCEELIKLAALLDTHRARVTFVTENSSAPENPASLPCTRMRKPGRFGPKWGSRQARETGGDNQVHPAICDGCQASISGIRFYCLNCKNFDLCSVCEQNNYDAPFHDESHVFAKIRDPATPYNIHHLISLSPIPDASIPLRHPHHRHHPHPSPPSPPHPYGLPFFVPGKPNNPIPDAIPPHPRHHPRIPRYSHLPPFVSSYDSNPDSPCPPAPHFAPRFRAHPQPHHFGIPFPPAPFSNPQPNEDAKVDEPAHYRAHPCHPPHFRHLFPGVTPLPSPVARSNEQENPLFAEETPQRGWWLNRWQHRAETMNRLQQLESSVNQLKETISALQNNN